MLILDRVLKVMICTSSGHYWIRPTHEELKNLRIAEDKGEVRLRYLTELDVRRWEHETGMRWRGRCS